MDIRITWRRRKTKSCGCGYCDNRIDVGDRYADTVKLPGAEGMNLCLTCGEDLEKAPRAMFEPDDDLIDAMDKAKAHGDLVHFDDLGDEKYLATLEPEFSVG